MSAKTRAVTMIDWISHWAEGWTAKVVSCLFATIVAPVIVAVGMKYSDAVLPPADVSASVGDASATNPSQTSATSIAAPADKTAPIAEPSALPSDPKKRSQCVRLFNGRDLTGFRSWLGPPKKGNKAIGFNRDPNQVFSVDGGVLRISGENDGFIFTKQSFENYVLTIEYRWGDKTWASRADKTRTSGVLLHLTGIAADPQSRVAIKCQIKEGATGDFVFFGEQHVGIPSLTVEADRREIDKGKQHLVLLMYKPGAPLTTVSTGFVGRTHRDSHWSDVKGFRGADELERPVGEWNTLECVCQGDTITTRLNGETVNIGTAARPQHGKIGLQSLGAEIFFRRVDLTPLP
ncbi:MAG TPA: DUF1080 domain-containing protein [Pirellulales bacterium]|nr:DUF1080 domain-containing protein [Pirellulales bacterium]